MARLVQEDVEYYGPLDAPSSGDLAIVRLGGMNGRRRLQVVFVWAHVIKRILDGGIGSPVFGPGMLEIVRADKKDPIQQAPCLLNGARRLVEMDCHLDRLS